MSVIVEGFHPISILQQPVESSWEAQGVKVKEDAGDDIATGNKGI